MNEPWYRQFWPWFLFGLPGLVVVAGLTTWWIAEKNADHLVADDYYKQGLAINRELDKQKRAQNLNLSARLAYRDGAFELTLVGDADPAAIVLYLSHPLDANLDRELRLPRMAPGSYRAPVQLARGSRWHWQLEPAQAIDTASWRLDGELRIPGADAN